MWPVARDSQSPPTAWQAQRLPVVVVVIVVFSRLTPLSASFTVREGLVLRDEQGLGLFLPAGVLAVGVALWNGAWRWRSGHQAGRKPHGERVVRKRRRTWVGTRGPKNPNAT